MTHLAGFKASRFDQGHLEGSRGWQQEREGRKLQSYLCSETEKGRKLFDNSLLEKQ